MLRTLSLRAARGIQLYPKSTVCARIALFSTKTPLYQSHSHTHNGEPCQGHSQSTSATSNTTTNEPMKMDHPMLLLAFTCKKCDTRSTHMMSKQAYNHGTILVQCPHCKVRHLMADHLKIFSDNKITIQDIMHAQGQAVSKEPTDLVWEEVPESLRSLVKERVEGQEEEPAKLA